MSLTYSAPALRTSIISLEEAILRTLAYSDIFDYPLTLQELHSYLHGVSATIEEVREYLSSLTRVESKDGYYFLSGRAEIVTLRESRAQISLHAFEHAIRYGRILGMLPFVRMVALTGSLALHNCDETADFDYMLVTSVGRVWTARAFALLLNRFAHLFGHTLCPNLVVSGQALEWQAQNLYLAREMRQMVLISGQGIYQRLFECNPWVQTFLPNALMESEGHVPQDGMPFRNPESVPVLQRFLEFLLHSPLGNWFESWEMNRKIARFTHQAGYGSETVFNADICQGNFDHHGAWARERYEKRISELRLNPSFLLVKDR